MPVMAKGKTLGYGPKGPTIEAASREPAVSSTLPIAAPASARASRELCPLDAGRRHGEVRLGLRLTLIFLYLYSARIARACCAAARRS